MLFSSRADLFSYGMSPPRPWRHRQERKLEAVVKNKPDWILSKWYWDAVTPAYWCWPDISLALLANRSAFASCLYRFLLSYHPYVYKTENFPMRMWSRLKESRWACSWSRGRGRGNDNVIVSFGVYSLATRRHSIVSVIHFWKDTQGEIHDSHATGLVIPWFQCFFQHKYLNTHFTVTNG